MTTKHHKTTKAPAKRSGNVFDVRRPGKAPAAATSRPVIVGHKPAAQKAQIAVSGVGEAPLILANRKITIVPHDPSAVEEKTDDKPFDPSETPILAPAKTIQPPTDPLLTLTPEDKNPPKVEEPATAAPTPVEPPQPPVPPPSPAPAPTPSPTIPPVPPTSLPPAEDQTFDEALAHYKIDPLFDEHGPVVSHHGSTSSAGKVIGLMLLIILLAAVTLNVLLDMGILTLDGVPHTNLFSNY